MISDSVETCLFLAGKNLAKLGAVLSKLACYSKIGHILYKPGSILYNITDVKCTDYGVS